MAPKRKHATATEVKSTAADVDAVAERVDGCCNTCNKPRSRTTCAVCGQCCCAECAVWIAEAYLSGKRSGALAVCHKCDSTGDSMPAGFAPGPMLEAVADSHREQMKQLGKKAGRAKLTRPADVGGNVAAGVSAAGSSFAKVSGVCSGNKRQKTFAVHKLGAKNCHLLSLESLQQHMPAGPSGPKAATRATATRSAAAASAASGTTTPPPVLLRSTASGPAASPPSLQAAASSRAASPRVTPSRATSPRAALPSILSRVASPKTVKQVHAFADRQTLGNSVSPMRPSGRPEVGPTRTSDSLVSSSSTYSSHRLFDSRILAFGEARANLCHLNVSTTRTLMVATMTLKLMSVTLAHANKCRQLRHARPTPQAAAAVTNLSAAAGARQKLLCYTPRRKTAMRTKCQARLTNAVAPRQVRCVRLMLWLRGLSLWLS